MISQDGPNGSQPAETARPNGHTVTNMTATEYWEGLFRSVRPQPRLYSFPLEYQAPRSETTLNAADGLLEQVLTFCTSHDVAIHDLLYAVWAIVSSRHMAGGQRTTVFAVDAADQVQPEKNGVDGPASDGYPLILTVSEDMDSLAWIRHVGKVNAEASSQSHIGYERILETGSADSLQVKVSITREQDSQDDFVTDADFPLVLDISISANIALSMRHNSRVDKMDVRVLLDHFITALSQAVHNPQSIISDLSMMSPTERQSVEEYGKASIIPSSGLIHHLIEQRAQQTPDADAVQFEVDKPLTFSTLNKMSNQLARELIIRGASRRIVPVHMSASVEFVVALLAVLKAGAAYVILDPESGAERRSYITRDVDADFILVDEATEGEFHKEFEVGDLLRQCSGHDDDNLTTDLTPSDLAYIIYTSGSSGNPKGVMLEHGAAYNGLRAFPQIAKLRQLLFYNPVFSAAQRSIWATLVVGGCLCLASKEHLTVHLTTMINVMQINSIDMTSTTATLLQPEKVPSLWRLALGGELVTSTVIQKWAHCVELYSSYGLSECTQLNWRNRFSRDANPRNMGRPFDTTSSYILTPDSTKLSPLLIPGELCLGGAQLARAYLNLPEESERRFVKNPFGKGRLYRTGDLAVRHADGSIEMIGRIDFQVKINGQKVDPGEPNTVIQMHPDVQQSAVVPVTVNKKMLLVAVVVHRAESDWDSLVENLRSSLPSKIPQYMVPSFWVPVPALPLNANGKVNIAAVKGIVEGLRDSGDLVPKKSRAEIDESAFTDDERVLRGLWSELLELPESQISRDDSFIALGGTSLEAIQVVSRLLSEHSLVLQVQDIILGNSLSHIAGLAQKQAHPASDNDQAIPFALLREPLSVEDLKFGYAEIEDAFPVTPFQEAAIADTVMGGKSFIYSRAYSFSGHTTDAVKAAFESLMKSEALLRATFVSRGSSFVQVIRKTAEVPWQTLDMDLGDFLKHKASDLMHTGGELWWRATILPGDVLVITTHHALFDFWSNAFTSQDISSILIGKTPINRPPFRRYVKHIQDYDDVTMKTFWSNYLEGASPIRLGELQGSEATVSAKLGFDLKAATTKLMVTPGVLLYAAWSVVLAITYSTDDVAFGITLSGREAPVPGVLQMNGPTLMVAPLRVRVNKASSFEGHLRNVQDSLWNVANHAQYGLRNILKTSRQSKDLMGSSVNFLVKLPPPKRAGGLVLLPENNLGTVDNVKLELDNSNPDLVTLVSALDPTFAQGLVDMVALVLKSASSAPLTKIGQWNRIEPTAKNPADLKAEDGIMNEMNGSKSQVHNTAHVSKENEHLELAHAAFQRMAARHPSNIAVEDSFGKRMTYAGLAIKANQLAHVLREKGVTLEQVVPLMLEKSINTVVAIFGVLVAGCAFLPLGPENPRERNLGILEDCGGQIVITDRSSADFFSGTDYDVIVIDDVEWDTIPIQKQIVPGLRPESLAYVIYTSGSTGKPKGTLLTHGGLAVAAEAINEATETKITDKFLWSPNYTFDGSLDTLSTALSRGCTLCLAPQSEITSNLAGLINLMKVTRTNMTPSMTTLVNPDQVPTLKLLITGGEAVNSKLLDKWSDHVALYNAYGPTEATISVTTKRIGPGMNLRNIGPAFKNVTAQILDPDTMAVMPRGSVGELCLSGPQLARGYWNRPDATAKAFHDGPNGKIYRTGDLARLLPNGDIELFGRKDDQVKINGYRIELGEIESVIAKTRAFEQCIVITATVLKKKQLVAFYSTTAESTEKQADALLLPADEAQGTDQVKNQLTTIPNYMVPTIWLPVAKFPFSVAGKIDRKRLQAHVESMDDALLKEYLPKEEISEINSGTELILQGLWSALFEIPTGDIHANSSFHAMGGDSISALNLVSMLRRHGYEVKVNDILSRNTLRQQAAFVDECTKSDEATAKAVTKEMQYEAPESVYQQLRDIGVDPDEVEDIYPCSPGQIEFLTQGNKDDQFWQLMAVRELPDDLDFNRWIQLTTKLTQNNQILRALYLYPEEGNPQSALQVVLRHPALNLDYQSFATEEEKQRILDAEWEARFAPSKPFVRYTLLVNETDGSRHLLVKLDHASYDGTLLHIFDAQFKALNRDEAIPKHTPFKDFIGHVLATPKQPQLDYWAELLAGARFDFPSSQAEPRLSKLASARVDVSVGVDRLASASGVTAPIVFQTAYSLLLARLAGVRDVVYDNLVTGRNVALDNPQLISGNCANFLPFRSRVADGQPVDALLRATQDAFWAATENGLVSLGEIHGPRRADAAAKCLFCFQPFEPAPPAGQQDHMRWIVMRMSKVRMHFNYAIQLEVVKAANKGEYVLRCGYDERAFSKEYMDEALRWYVECLRDMAKGGLVGDLRIEA